jgi:predicted ester cyclase
MKREYGDFEFEIEELICEGSKVYARWRQRGNGVTQVTSCVYLVEDGLITEYWIQIDRLGLQLQSPKQ